MSWSPNKSRRPPHPTPLIALPIALLCYGAAVLVAAMVSLQPTPAIVGLGIVAGGGLALCGTVALDYGLCTVSSHVCRRCDRVEEAL